MREISLLAVGEKGKHPGRLDEGHAQFKHRSESQNTAVAPNQPTILFSEGKQRVQLCSD